MNPSKGSLKEQILDTVKKDMEGFLATLTYLNGKILRNICVYTVGEEMYSPVYDIKVEFDCAVWKYDRYTERYMPVRSNGNFFQKTPQPKCYTRRKPS